MPGEDWLVAPITSAEFGLKRPEVISLRDSKSAPHPLATLTQPVRLTGGIGRVNQKMYILATEPARFTRFYDKLKNDPGFERCTLSPVRCAVKSSINLAEKHGGALSVSLFRFHFRLTPRSRGPRAARDRFRGSRACRHG